MFQNLAEEIGQDYEDVEVNKKKYALNKIFTIQNMIIYILSFFISTVNIKDGIIPFGMAIFAASCGTTVPAGMVLITSLIGTFVKFGLNATLSYILTVLIFIASVVLIKPHIQSDRNETSKLGKNLIFSCIVVQAIQNLIGTIYVYDVLMSIITVIITYIFYKIFVNSLVVIEQFNIKQAFTIEEVIGASILISIAAVAVNGYRIYGISISNVISIFLILVLAWKNGILVGATTGISLGLVLGIIGIITPMEVLSFAISGMLAGCLSKIGRLGTIGGFIIGNSLLSYISTGSTIEIIPFKEILISSIVLFFVPKYVEINIKDLIGNTKLLGSFGEKRLSESKDTSSKLNNISDAISEIVKSVGVKDESLIKEEIENINNSKMMFVEDFLNNIDGFPNNILYEDLIDTEKGIVEDIYNQIIEKEELNSQDLIKIFEKRNDYIVGYEDNEAIKQDIEQIVRIINRTYRINEINFAWKKRLQDSRKTISKQLDGVSKAISEIAEDISKNKENKFKKKEDTLKNLLSQKEIIVKEIKIKQNKTNRYFVDLYYPNNYIQMDNKKIKCIENIITKILGEKIVFQKDTKNIDSENYMQRYISEDKYTMQIGVAKVVKAGNNISGDSNIQIILDDNKYLLALSDGMGSGVEARKSSQIVIKMLKKLLTAGFEKDDSIELINSTVKLSTEEIYATIDTAIIDLYTGTAEFVKNGACKTYIKNKQNVTTVESNSLPLGILNNVDLTVYDKDIEDGDILVMCTDGITESSDVNQNDKWLEKILQNINTNNVQKMADIILNEAIDNCYGIPKDDMTIITAKFTKKV